MRMSLPLVALAGALCLAGACGRQAPPEVPGSKVKLSVKPKVTSAAHANGATDICATFTVTPYSFDPQHRPVAAGSAVTFATSHGGSAVDQILGCVNGTPYFTPPAGSPGSYGPGPFNWAYFLSATDFQYCDPGVQADPVAHSLPVLVAGSGAGANVNPAPPFFVPVNCDTSNDVPLQINYPIAISAPAPGGYIDISAGVDASTVMVGCKKADFDPNGTGDFHFGESFAIDSTAAAPKTAVPLGLIGYQISNPLAGTYVSQYGGVNWAADPDGDVATQLYSTYYTAQFTTAAPALPSVVLQTYLSNADQTHLFGAPSPGDQRCTGGEWVDTRHPMCLTEHADARNPATLTTKAMLADTFLYDPGLGYAAVSVPSGGASISIYSQMAPNSGLGNDYTSVPVTSADATVGFASRFGSPVPAGAGFNDGLTHTAFVLADKSGLLSFTGSYIDPSAPRQFLIGGTIAGGSGPVNAWATLSWSSSASRWELSDFTDIAAGVPPGFGVAVSGCVGFGPGFHATGALLEGRGFYTATLLQNGQVLMTGGMDANYAVLASAELYSPAAGIGTFASTGSLNFPRNLQTATLLPDTGQVLVLGGGGSPNPLLPNQGSAELYAQPTFPLASVSDFTAFGARSNHAATFLPVPDKVLVVGGRNDANSDALASAFLYSSSGGYQAAGSLNTARSDFTATLLDNGKVLIVGGTDNTPYFDSSGAVIGGPFPLSSAELYVYDSTGGGFSFTPPPTATTGYLKDARAYHTATLLPGGKVLIAGGLDRNGQPLASAQLYDPNSGTFADTTGPLLAARGFATATLLTTGANAGKVLIIGGNGAAGVLASAELYNPATGKFESTGSLAVARFSHTATRLLDGHVLVAGGNGVAGPLSSAELYY